MNLWKHQTDCILECASRILVHHTTLIGNRKQSFFPMSAKRRNTSKPVWTTAVTSLPLWFYVMEMKPRSVVLHSLTGSLTKKSGTSYSETSYNLLEAKDERCKFVQATHLCIQRSRIPTISRMSQHPQWEDGAGISLF